MSELIATRQAFGETLFEIMKEDERVMALTADLGESLRMLEIREEMPERFLDVGVAEANMAGVAAGLALGGLIPVAGTFGIFLTRAFDHIRLQICQNNLHAIMVGSHGGVSNALDGGSAHALEDIAYMRSLPNMMVVFPGDANEMRKALRAVINIDSPVYLRLYREATPVFTNTESPFELGKANVWREGNDVTVVGTGPQTAFALEAALSLQEEGISVEVINVHTIKPLDVSTIVLSAEKTGRVVTVEDHNINGGLGSAVAEALSEHHPTPLKRVGVTQFGESGKYYELTAKLGIDTDGIKRTVKDLLNLGV
jgi:transketolase